MEKLAKKRTLSVDLTEVRKRRRLEDWANSSSLSDSPESVYSVQQHDTEPARDTEDTTDRGKGSDSDSEMTEYELLDADDHNLINPLVTSDSDDTHEMHEIVELGAVVAAVRANLGDIDMGQLADTSTEVSTSPSSFSDADPELPRQDWLDFWRCIKCKAENDNRHVPLCMQCYSDRKQFYPDRPRRRLVVNRTRSFPLQSRLRDRPGSAELSAGEPKVSAIGRFHSFPPSKQTGCFTRPVDKGLVANTGAAMKRLEDAQGLASQVVAGDASCQTKPSQAEAGPSTDSGIESRGVPSPETLPDVPNPLVSAAANGLKSIQNGESQSVDTIGAGLTMAGTSSKHDDVTMRQNLFGLSSNPKTGSESVDVIDGISDVSARTKENGVGSSQDSVALKVVNTLKSENDGVDSIDGIARSKSASSKQHGVLFREKGGKFVATDNGITKNCKNNDVTLAVELLSAKITANSAENADNEAVDMVDGISESIATTSKQVLSGETLNLCTPTDAVLMKGKNQSFTSPGSLPTANVEKSSQNVKNLDYDVVNGLSRSIATTSKQYSVTLRQNLDADVTNGRQENITKSPETSKNYEFSIKNNQGVDSVDGVPISIATTSRRDGTISQSGADVAIGTILVKKHQKQCVKSSGSSKTSDPTFQNSDFDRGPSKTDEPREKMSQVGFLKQSDSCSSRCQLFSIGDNAKEVTLSDRGESSDAAERGGWKRGERTLDMCQLCTLKPADAAFVHRNTYHGDFACYNCARNVWRTSAYCPLCRRKITNVCRKL